MGTAIQSAIEELDQLPDHRLYGRVDSVLGLVVEVAGLERGLSVGGRCRVFARDGQPVVCEAIGFRKGHAALMPFGTLEGGEPQPRVALVFRNGALDTVLTEASSEAVAAFLAER